MQHFHLVWIFICPMDPENSGDLTQQYPLATADFLLQNEQRKDSYLQILNKNQIKFKYIISKGKSHFLKTCVQHLSENEAIVYSLELLDIEIRQI